MRRYSQVIEEEVKRLLEEAYGRAWGLLTTHEAELHMLAAQLLERETLTGAELRRMMKLPMKSGDASFIGETFANASGAAAGAYTRSHFSST